VTLSEDPRDLGVQLKLHSLRGPYFAIRVPGVLIVVHALRGLTFKLRCTELSGVPSSSSHCVQQETQCPSGQLVLFVPRCLGALIIILGHICRYFQGS